LPENGLRDFRTMRGAAKAHGRWRGRNQPEVIRHCTAARFLGIRAGDTDADQRCGSRKQYSARKARAPATRHMRIGTAGWKLLCKVQKQNCLRFAQFMISF
jgi:hypothetical protein